MSQRFRHWEHLRRPADFRRVYDRKRSISDDLIILFACPNDLPHSRIGLSVSRRFGNAVRRNKLRRLYREAFRCTKTELPTGLDLVIVPRSDIMPSLVQLLESFRTLTPKVAKRLAKEAKSP